MIFKTHRHAVRLWSATDIELIITSEEIDHPFFKRIGPDVLNESCNNELIEESLMSKVKKKECIYFNA